MDHSKLTKEEIGRLADELYDRQIRDRVEADESNIGKMIILDVSTGDYEIDEEGIEAARRLRLRHPEGTLYGLRIGYDVPEGFGYVPQRVKR
jgi:hypothetical protein